MRIRVAVPDEHVTPEVVEPVLEAVTRLNEQMIRTGQTPTSHELIAQGAVWRPENMGDEHFDHGGTIASRGWGDCDDWGPLHTATLRTSGEDPGARTIMVPSGPNTYHALTQRSDGRTEDPSIAAGMKSEKPSNISGEESAEVWARDPYDGRIYQGAMAGAVGPLSLHSGPGIAIRGCRPIAGCPAVYQGRVDLPIVGSRMVRVRSFMRRRPGRGRHVHGSVLPYALSVSSLHPNRFHALRGAIAGALILGDASAMTADIDRYKLIALQHAMAGASPGQVHELLVNQLHQDLYDAAQQSGQHPEAHSKALLMQTMKPGVAGPAIVGGFFSDLGHIASSVVSDVSKVASSIAKTAGPWVGDVLHGVEAAVSVVPGLGTAVADVVAAAETAYDSAAALMHGNPLEAGIDAAYNFATSTIPGAAALRFVLDPVKATLIGLTLKKEPIDSSVLDGILAAVPDAPKIGSLSPRSVAASLAHLIVGHLGVKHAKNAPKPKSKPAAKPPPPPHPNVIHAPLITTPAKPAVKAVHVVPHVKLTPAAIKASKPFGHAHAAYHKVTRQLVDTVNTHV